MGVLTFDMSSDSTLDQWARAAGMNPQAMTIEQICAAMNATNPDWTFEIAVWNLREMIFAVAPNLNLARTEAIVQVHARGITTLTTRNSDSCDFHTLAIWTLVAILRNAITAY